MAEKTHQITIICLDILSILQSDTFEYRSIQKTIKAIDSSTKLIPSTSKSGFMFYGKVVA